MSHYFQEESLLPGVQSPLPGAEESLLLGGLTTTSRSHHFQEESLPGGATTSRRSSPLPGGVTTSRRSHYFLEDSPLLPG